MTRSKIIALVRLFRFELSFTAGICVILGELLALGGPPSLAQAVLGFLSIFCISATALILNDYFDVETDRINCYLLSKASGRLPAPKPDQGHPSHLSERPRPDSGVHNHQTHHFIA